MRKSLLRLALHSAICLTAALLHASSGATPAGDAFLWVEEVEGPRTLAWASADNERMLSAPQSDSSYDRFYRDALTIGQAKHRSPFLSLQRQGLESFWQDESHVCGIWPRTTLEGYRPQDCRWETILDIDVLAIPENSSWVDSSCVARRCLIKIVACGEDAVPIRESENEAKSLVANGFELPEHKHSVSWRGRETVLVARDWGEGIRFEAGHAFRSQELRRAQPFDQPREVFLGQRPDLGIVPLAFGERRIAVTRIVCWTNGSERQYALFGPAGPIELDSPTKASIVGIASRSLLVKSNEDCIRYGDTSFKVGSMISYDLVEWKQDPLRAKPHVVFRPKCRQALCRFDDPRNFRQRLTCQGKAFVCKYLTCHARPVAADCVASSSPVLE
ncbi:S9 family peptidase [Bradyrhizobium glycinis]|uniref:S9 family peptidase n=1 Tax=Bradyrhizobium glycinis TaxID=2751812 RepID=UPI0018D6D1DA|nr:S9 family peptidase [Bradyrhizobium glycinis]MBH5371028.1 S9 family peptidase [Bradyrhizobium glycinis]